MVILWVTRCHRLEDRGMAKPPGSLPFIRWHINEYISAPTWNTAGPSVYPGLALQLYPWFGDSGCRGTVSPGARPPRNPSSEPAAVGPAVPYYPRIFSKEYFYRDNESQPIRDFRYYNLKTQPNYVAAKKNVVLRDFRFDYWRYKEYR